MATVPTSSDDATIVALRADVALQIARVVALAGETQVEAASRLGIPQPTLRKIVNGHTRGLSLELLIRIAVRAGLPLVLQTGTDPCEAGAYVAQTRAPYRAQPSRLANQAREELLTDAQRLTPEQRLLAQMQHSELLFALHRDGKTQRASASGPAKRRAR